MPTLPPARRGWRALAATLLLVGPLAAPAATPAALPSRLDAPLFYQLLIGELELRGGQPGAAYAVVLDAARRTGDELLFKRATDIALESRAGDQALAAARAWRERLPKSLEAHRYVVQILIALGRTKETVEPLQSLVGLVPEAERSALIVSLPRLYGRAADRAAVPALLEQALKAHAQAASTRVAVQVAIGRAWLAAGQPQRALDHARRARSYDAKADGGALLAIELMPGTPAAESLVTDYLQARPDATPVRLLYARTLTSAQRYADAIAQLDAVTRAEPRLAPPWLTLGALHLELRQAREAEAALQTYVKLVESPPPAAAGASAPAGEDDDDEALGISGTGGLVQAWLMLAQAAELRGDFALAEAWLARIDDPQRLREVQLRRASLLARQGKVAEARALVRALPEAAPSELRAKFLAEAQLLRDVKRWADANTVLAEANRRFPDDADLLYEQSMMSEKLDRLDEMEQLLRRVIALKPDFHHAYNALGYSLADRNVRLPEAKALIQKALELSPGEPFITDSLGWVEFRLGNRDEALRLLRTAYSARPDTEIGAHLGEVLWVLGRHDEARRVWREAYQRDADNDVLREVLRRLKVEP
jgi:tetratricopeptide (TPR) repeat protein